MEGTFEIFGLTGYRLGLCACIGTLVLFLVMLLLSGKRGVKPTSVCLMSILGMVFGIVAARALYCLVNLSDFLETYENWLLTLRFFDGGFSIAGLLLGLLLAVCLTAAITRENLAELMDILCVPVGLLFCALYLGQQDSGLGIGRIVNEGFATKTFPWLFLCERMGVNVEYRLLVYLYQAIAAIAIAAAMIPLYLHWQRSNGFRAGEAAMVSLAVYGAVMVVLESLRDDGHMLIIFLRIGQVVAALLPVVTVAVFAGCYRRLHGKADHKVIAAWVAIVIFIAGIVVLEFALDGRLAVIKAEPVHYYAVMALLSLVMVWLDFSLHRAVMKCRTAASEALPQ